MAVGAMEEMDRHRSSTRLMSGAEGLQTSTSFKKQMHQDVATTKKTAMEWK
jgi:hypothetical protein